ncbi:hypothetical protein CKO31_18270 [Thiohalocapsa halophila]|uniref:Uncharacterized protein n=1 Tax=Thiohalocapsa halophila TaxID=69359 RepID=A0ABS1CLD3_9GAMM|nr:hypothetical protein [Thiohalocapsa halophila]MBK1632652.1 hypothetical protein [Thiohalocapsa halophila]
MTSPQPTDPRPRQVVTAVARAYPDAWTLVDRMRAGRGGEFPDWPEWCFLPLQGIQAVIGRGAAQLPPERFAHIGIVGALAAWRVSQGIYRFDPDLAAAVAETPLTGELPAALLYRLPEWCVYIETPGRTYGGRPLHGFWAHLDYEVDGGNDELRLVLDVARTPAEAMDPVHGQIPVPLILGGGTLTDALERVIESGKQRAQALGLEVSAEALGDAEAQAAAVAPLVALVLYLCAENAEIGDDVTRPARPEPKRTKRGPRLFPPPKATSWDVGVRIGAALRRTAVGEGDPAASAGEGSRSRPRAHIRRAHWHTFRIGEGRTGRKVRWVAPVTVNVEDTGALPATVHRAE